jgi:hypothetical protein
MLDWIRGLFSLPPTEQLKQIEKHEPTLQEQLAGLTGSLAGLTGRLKGFKQKTAEELDEIINDLNTVLDIVETIISALENIGGVKRATDLRTRLKGYKTRALNARSRAAA